MADACVEMAGEDDSPEKCREARRRRMEMRRILASTVSGGEGQVKRYAAFGPTKGSPSEKRLRASSGDEDDDVGALSRPSRTQAFASSSSTSLSSSSSGEGPARTLMEEKAGAEDSSVVFGSISLAGRSREMEDAVSVRPVFFRPEGGLPLHFFAVFDGHGGSHVAALCKSRMHVLLAEELRRLPPCTPSTAEEERMKTALHRCFSRMDELALSSCACGKVGMPLCTCDRSGIESEIVGTTAALAIVSLDRVVVANCGDSRAVLSRGGRAVPLSSDHKPDRPDEQARIEAAGGRVIYLNGARVHGILAMSRALGDKYLKPVVISEPEICSVERTPQDEFLIIASDGLWDVLPNELACSVARRCLLETAEQAAEDAGSSSTENIDEAGRGEEQASDARCSLAATLLARLALGRRSADNISVIVINLRRLTRQGVALL